MLVCVRVVMLVVMVGRGCLPSSHHHPCHPIHPTVILILIVVIVVVVVLWCVVSWHTHTTSEADGSIGVRPWVERVGGEG